jgi:hypothetical protein
MWWSKRIVFLTLFEAIIYVVRMMDNMVELLLDTQAAQQE